jgi:hypothetical protein
VGLYLLGRPEGACSVSECERQGEPKGDRA